MGDRKAQWSPEGYWDDLLAGTVARSSPLCAPGCRWISEEETPWPYSLSSTDRKRSMNCKSYSCCPISTSCSTSAVSWSDSRYTDRSRCFHSSYSWQFPGTFSGCLVCFSTLAFPFPTFGGLADSVCVAFESGSVPYVHELVLSSTWAARTFWKSRRFSKRSSPTWAGFCRWNIAFCRWILRQ